MSKRINHKEFAQEDQAFRTACEKAGVEPTSRQASKWRRKFGAAWKAK